MIFYYLIFLVASIGMLPLAFLFSLLVKIKKLQTASSSREMCAVLGNILFFLILGLPLLTLSLVADFFYFWKNNFRTGLKQVVIERVISTINMSTIKLLRNLCQKFNAEKIRSMLSHDVLRIFTSKYKLYQNMQTIVFGQDVQVAKKKAS